MKPFVLRASLLELVPFSLIGIPLPITSETVHASLSHITHSLLLQVDTFYIANYIKLKRTYSFCIYSVATVCGIHSYMNWRTVCLPTDCKNGKSGYESIFGHNI